MNYYVMVNKERRKPVSMVMCEKCKVYWDAAEVKKCPICNLSLPGEYDEAQGEANEQEETIGTTRAEETNKEEAETREGKEEQATDTDGRIQDKEQNIPDNQ